MKKEIQAIRRTFPGRVALLSCLTGQNPISAERNGTEEKVMVWQNADRKTREPGGLPIYRNSRAYFPAVLIKNMRLCGDFFLKGSKEYCADDCADDQSRQV